MEEKNDKKRCLHAVKLTNRPCNQSSDSFELEPFLKRIRRRSIRLKAASEARQHCFPVQVSHKLKPPCYDPRKYTVDVWEPDRVNMDDPQYCSVYITDIYQHLFQAERFGSASPYPHRGEKQATTLKKRATIVNWLVQIHQRFRLCSDDSLHLAVNIFDRYNTALFAVKDEVDLQLVGAACLLIASKFEDIDPPTLKELIKTARKTFSIDDLLDMESDILSELQFKIRVPTGIPFLKRFLFLTKASPLMEEAAKYYLERLLLEHDSLREPPSLLAAACVCLALNHPRIREAEQIETQSPGIPANLCEYTGYPSMKIRRVANFVAGTVAHCPRVQNAFSTQELNAVRRKHSIAGRFRQPLATDIV